MKRLGFVLAVVTALATGLVSAGAVESIPPPLGQSSFQGEWAVFIHFQDSENPIPITNLSGTSVGEGTHLGQLLCGKICNQQTQLTLGSEEYLYRFETRQALDPDERVVVVTGRGTISGQGQKERFSFTATFRDNQDGTLWVRYDASRPDASFIVPNTPGLFALFLKN